ncbi:MAG TPA: hypothetical protein VK698_19810 [Kofleriaceae bacterium]|nr:hypothetical protein [Kofleriaceae bacterium]
MNRITRWCLPRWCLAAGLAATVMAGAPRPVRAQSAEKCDEGDNAEAGGEKTKKKNYRTVIGPDGRKVFVIEKAFVVCGKVPKPTVIYALQASTINYEWETLTQDFLPKVIEATRKAPF